MNMDKESGARGDTDNDRDTDEHNRANEDDDSSLLPLLFEGDNAPDVDVLLVVVAARSVRDSGDITSRGDDAPNRPPSSTIAERRPLGDDGGTVCDRITRPNDGDALDDDDDPNEVNEAVTV
jgi:hypothetical protein